MTHDRLTEILRWTLDGQPEANSTHTLEPVPTEESMLEALSGERPLDADEKLALLRSPAARGRLRFLAQARRAEQLLRWRQHGVQTTLQRQAAAGGPLTPVSVSNNDFTLTALPLDADATAWLLHLKVTPGLVADLRGTRLTLRDDQGDTWLTGELDEDGEISASWTLEGTPSQRLAAQRLFIEPA